MSFRLAARRSFIMSSSRNFATTSTVRVAAPQQGPWADALDSTPLNRYIVVAEDHADAGANARRLEVRERHLEQARNGKQVGRIELGGALLKKDFDQIDPEIGPGPMLGGSVLIVQGTSIEDVRARVMQDEYVQGNVWDLSKLKIYPFLQAPMVANTNTEQPTTQPSATLGQLRQDTIDGKGHKIITLGSLRKTQQSSPPPSA